MVIECESQSMTFFFAKIISHSFLWIYFIATKIFENVAVATRKQPTNTIKAEKDEIIRGNFYQNELNKIL